MQHISQQELEEFRSALHEEKNNLEKELKEHGRREGGNWQGTSSGFSGNEPDETDLADKMEELATNIPLVEELEKRLKDVEDALKKVEDGTYGTDEKTGEPIVLARLKANPAARTNI